MDWIKARLRALQQQAGNTYASFDRGVFGGSLPGGAQPNVTADDYDRPPSANPTPSTWRPGLHPTVEENIWQNDTLQNMQDQFAQGDRISTGVEGTVTNIYGNENTLVSAPQINPNHSSVKTTKVCPIDRNRFNRGQAAMGVYGKRTQDGPDNGMNACVEAVQRTIAHSGQPRIPTGGGGWKDKVRNFPVQLPGVNEYIGQGAQNVTELRDGILRDGRGYQIPISEAGQGDIAIKKTRKYDKDNKEYWEPYHALIGTDKVTEDGVPLFNSNSGSAGAIVGITELKDDYSTKFDVYRLRSPEELQQRYSQQTQNDYRRSGGGF